MSWLCIKSTVKASLYLNICSIHFMYYGKNLFVPCTVETKSLQIPVFLSIWGIVCTMKEDAVYPHITPITFPCISEVIYNHAINNTVLILLDGNETCI